MKAVAQKKPAENDKRQSSLANHRSAKQPTFSSSFLSNDKILIQRKPICPCDGGCPCCARVIQPKLTIGQPNDKYEQEADRVADQVMRMPEPKVQRQELEEEEELQTKPLASQITPLVQRQAVPEEELEDEEEENIQAEGKTGNTPTVTPQIAANINALRGSGQPLPESVRAYFEPRFGHNFSRIHVHSNPEAFKTTNVLNAKAFTIGRDVVFGAGQYAPETIVGRRLLAHELAHTLQQSAAGVALVQRQIEIPVFDKLDICTLTPWGKVCGSDAVKVCEKMPTLPGCSKVCKVFGCKKTEKPAAQCPPGFHAATSSDFKGQCCHGTIENAKDCCPPERAVFKYFPRCCAEDEVVYNGSCAKSAELPPLPPSVLCPSWRKTTIGICCTPPLKPKGPICVLPRKPPQIVKPPVTPPLPKAMEIFFKFNRPWLGEIKAAALKASVTTEGLKNFNALVAELSTDPSLRVQLVGKASPEGVEDYNFKLGARRARLVKAALVDIGIEKSRILDPLTDKLNPRCKKLASGLVTCGEVGATDKRDRQVLARVFPGP